MISIFPSFIAGIAIGLGCWLYLSAPSSIVGAILFSCGLLAVRLFKLDLFTGKTQFMPTTQYKWYQYIIILIFNLIGILIMVTFASEEIKQKAMIVGLSKVEIGNIALLANGIGCGMLMTIATNKDTPLYVTALCVFAFVICGFNHCIADAFYLIAAGQLTFKWLFILIGNIIGGVIVSPYLGTI